MTKNVQIDGSKITNWDSFHDCFSRAFGFPEFYGRNVNAWIDCLADLDEPETGMSSVHVSPGDTLVLCLSEARDLKKRCSDGFDALVECSALVNRRRIELGKPAVLALSFHD